MLELYPGVQISIGPPIENGFYYDLDLPDGVTLNEDDFPAIEARMREHIDADEEFVREDVPVAVALDRYRGEGQSYKVELIEDLVKNAPAEAPVDDRSASTPTGSSSTSAAGRTRRRPSGSRPSSCSRSPVPTGAGTPSNKMLTRVYGTAFFSNKDLEEYLERLERAAPNDHRRLGPLLGMFGFSETAPGSAFWFPPGAAVWNELVKLSREMGAPRGYTEVKTPLLYRQLALEDLRPLGQVPRRHVHHRVRGPADGAQADELPGPLPAVSVAAALLPRSARALLGARPAASQRAERHAARAAARPPLRPGRRATSSVPRTRSRMRSPACLQFAFDTYKLFGLDVRLELSTRPENRIGSDELWDHSEQALKNALDGHGLEYTINEGDGAFYGPKIDMHMTDSLGRSWQLGTCQLDYNFPERFDLTYTGADNAEHQPVMIHRALMGSYERFIGILLEHFGGELPRLAGAAAGDRRCRSPTATTRMRRTVRDRMAAANIRVELDDRTESVGRKIRDAEVRKVPFMLVVGDREQETGEVGVREHRAGDTGAVAFDDFLQRITELISTRALMQDHDPEG